MCPPASPHKGASIVQSPHMIWDFGMETPLRGRSGGHTGTAPTVRLGRLHVEWVVSFGQITRKWLFCLCGIAWKNMMEICRGGACVPTRVAPQGCIHRYSRALYVYFWYGNATTRTFGRAHRRRPYAFCLRELRVGVRPYARLSIKGAFVVHPVQGWHFHSAWKRRFSFLFVSLQAIKM